MFDVDAKLSRYLRTEREGGYDVIKLVMVAMVLCCLRDPRSQAYQCDVTVVPSFQRCLGQGWGRMTRY